MAATQATWKCPSCSFLNDPSLNQCAMCKTAAQTNHDVDSEPTRGAAASAAAAVADVVAGAVAGAEAAVSMLSLDNITRLGGFATFGFFGASSQTQPPPPEQIPMTDAAPPATPLAAPLYSSAPPASPAPPSSPTPSASSTVPPTSPATPASSAAPSTTPSVLPTSPTVAAIIKLEDLQLEEKHFAEGGRCFTYSVSPYRPRSCLTAYLAYRWRAHL